jgi:ABC-2 type transport system ATP-binding protein
VAAIEIRALTKRYGDVSAVDDLSFSARAGRVTGFLGPNGAGKSTTILMLTTLLPPSAGTARVAGHDIRRESPAVRRVIGAALQEVALDPLLTGREHLQLQAALQGIAKAERRNRVDELLERVGLAAAAGRRVAGYSGGMKRRLDLALALVHRPRVLFLDEPTIGLDPQSRADLWDEVRRLARVDGVTVFLTTQYLEEADVLADRVGIIDAGRIVAEGPPEDLKAQSGPPRVEVTPADPRERERLHAVLGRFGVPTTAAPGNAAVQLADSAEPLTDLVRALDDEGLRVRHLELHQPSLDDVFLSKTGRKLDTDAQTSYAAGAVAAS